RRGLCTKVVVHRDEGGRSLRQCIGHLRPMRASIDQSLLQVLNNDTADVRSRPRNTLESALTPDERKLAFAFVFLSHTSNFSIRDVLAFMRPHDAESRMPFFTVLTNKENRLTIQFGGMNLRRC